MLDSRREELAVRPLVLLNDASRDADLRILAEHLLTARADLGLDVQPVGLRLMSVIQPLVRSGSFVCVFWLSASCSGTAS